MKRRTRSAASSAGAPSGTARAAALRLLGRRDYTAVELRKALAAKGFPPDDVGAALDRLRADGLVDDRRVAAAFLRTASRIKGRGSRRIERELVERGIDRSLAADLVRGLSPADEAAALERVLLRRKLSSQPSTAEIRRVFAHLLRRGFTAEAIRTALRQRGADPADD